MVERFTLDNGMTILIKEMHHAPVASFWMWYRVGSGDERAGITGISHWVEPTTKLDTITMLGFILLIGIVVNNAILIVHQSLNHMRDAGMAPRESIRESVRNRMRPIFMSVST